MGGVGVKSRVHADSTVLDSRTQTGVVRNMSACARWVIAICVAGALGALMAPLAQAADAKAGLKLSEKWCASCHVIGPGAVGGVSDAAPTFASIANRPGTSAESLQAFLADPHKAAMKGIVLPRFEIDDLAAYIISLKESPQ